MRSRLDPGQHRVVVSRPPQASKADLEGYANHALAKAPEGEFTIVGRSLGAVVGLKVIDLAPDRVARFLAVAGVVPPPGGSFVSAMPFPNRLVLDLVMRFAGTRPPDKAIRSTLAGLDPGLVERASRTSPQNLERCSASISTQDREQSKPDTSTHRRITNCPSDSRARSPRTSARRGAAPSQPDTCRCSKTQPASPKRSQHSRTRIGEGQRRDRRASAPE